MSRRLGRPGAILAALAAVIIGLPPAPLAASEPHPYRSAAPEQVVDDRIELALLDQRFSVGPDGTLRFVYRVDGDLGLFQLGPEDPSTDPTVDEPVDAATDPASDDEATEPEPPPLTIEVSNYPPLRTATRLSSTQQLVGPDIPERVYVDVYDGGSPIDGVQLVDVRPLFEVGDDGTTTLTIEVPTDIGESEAANLKLDDPGLYPIRMQLKIGPIDDAVEIASHGTIIERLPGDPAVAGSGRAPVGLAVMSAIPDAASNAAADELLDAAIELADQLTSPITLLMPPAAVVGGTGDAARADLLATSFDGDELIADTLRPLDVSSAVAVGLGDLYARELVLGEEVLIDAAPLGDVARTAWITLEPLSAAGAQELRDLGFRYLVMDPERFDELIGGPLPDSDRLVEVALPDGGTLPMLLIDPVADALSSEATEEILTDRTSFEWAVATASGWLLADAPSRTERTRLLSGPGITPPDPTLIEALEVLADGTPSLAFVEGSRVPSTTSVQRTPSTPLQLPDTAGPSLADRVGLLDAAKLAVASVDSMLADDDARPADWTERLDGLLSTGVSDEDARSDVDSLLADLDEIKQSVVPPEPFTFTLTGRSGSIELQLGNRSDEPLDVVVMLSSPKVEFPEGEQQITLQPNADTTVIVPVRALANGTSSVDVTVLTPLGEELATDITLTSRVTAFTGMAQVLTGGFLLVLATWWIAHWRKKRREAAADVHRARHPSSGSKPDASTESGDESSGDGQPDSLPTS